MVVPTRVLLDWGCGGEEDGGMGEIVNLRRIKKQRDRAAAEQAAAENRVRHGRTLAAKKAERIEQERGEAALDGAKKSPFVNGDATQ
jgi:hypothetical protein